MRPSMYGGETGGLPADEPGAYCRITLRGRYWQSNGAGGPPSSLPVEAVVGEIIACCGVGTLMNRTMKPV